MDEDRSSAMSRFITECGWSDSTLTSLMPDASFRQYHRLHQQGRRAMLIDAPPDRENLEAFVSISVHLHELGIRCPEIYQYDLSRGFALIEDLGKLTFTHLLNRGVDETFLYSQAIRLLAELHNHPGACHLHIDHYDFDHFINEARLFTDWYLPATTGKRPNNDVKEHYVKAWQEVYEQLPRMQDTLVLRDYHVDNLMQVENQCAVLDYQDALIGSIAYDLISLLEDARRDISDDLRQNMIQLYWSLHKGVDRDDFLHHCIVWGAGRHAKVAGIFSRLWIRDNKPVYLKHIPRVLRYLEQSMKKSELKPVQNWFSEQDIKLIPVDGRLERKSLLNICG